MPPPVEKGFGQPIFKSTPHATSATTAAALEAHSPSAAPSCTTSLFFSRTGSTRRHVVLPEASTKSIVLSSSFSLRVHSSRRRAMSSSE